RGGMRMGWGATKTLVYDDMTAILRECPSVKAAAPGSQASAQVVFGNDNWATNLNGTEPPYFDIRSWPFAEGTSFSQDDVNLAAMDYGLGGFAAGQLHRPTADHGAAAGPAPDSLGAG